MAISLIQTATGGAFSNSFTAVFGSNVTAGNTLLIFVSLNSTTTTITGISGNSNTYTPVLTGNSFTPEFYLYEVDNATGGTTTITITTSTSLSLSIIAREYSGLTSSSFDQSSTHWASGTSGTSNASGTTTQANELVVGCFTETVNGGSMSLGSGFSNLATISAGTQLFSGMEDMIVSTSGTQTATMTVNGGGQWLGMVATFKAATSAPTSILIPYGRVG